jgi:hypothetical protein
VYKPGTWSRRRLRGRRIRNEKPGVVMRETFLLQEAVSSAWVQVPDLEHISLTRAARV